MAVEGRSTVVLNMHARLQISLQTRFLWLLHRPVSVHLAMAYAGCLFNSFSVFTQFKTTTKSHENYVFLYPFSCIHSPSPPPKGDFLIFYTGKLYGLTGMLFQYLQNERETETGLKFNSDDNNRLFMVPHLIRAQRAYRDIRIHLFHQLTHTE